jgi:hypothetical protein
MCKREIEQESIKEQSGAKSPKVVFFIENFVERPKKRQDKRKQFLWHEYTVNFGID